MSESGALEGRTAIVTGGASGIGKATCLLFAREGASVAVVDQDEAGAKAVAEAIGDQGGEAIFLQADVASEEECRGVVDAVKERFGHLDILFNNAGIIRRTSVVDSTPEEWDRVVAVNLRSVFLMSKFALPIITAGGGGAIVNTSSGWGLMGGKRAASYCATKAAVVNLTRAMALDHASDNVRVNCVCPGDTATPMLADEARQLGEDEDDFMEDAADRPLGRIGTPEDVAQAVLYLASDASSFVTGVAFPVDGGGTAG
jgi:NAD(P)-dependent dehydrogenase (short-subunit alcohol dehydrogenase family)